MKINNILNALYSNSAILFQSKNIFLISHMRGNTSLLSHLLGSHPLIDGYYEMHIGYYSWKSLIRQKLLYLQDHKTKKTSRYLFDKILHNDHAITDPILTRKNSKVIFMVREPEQTIKSIVNIYRQKEPLHHYCNIEDAACYYASRLREIRHLAQKTKGGFYFVQADLLKSESEKTLTSLAKWLELGSPITKTYSQFKNTGKEKYGDSSKSIMTGKIQNKKTDYSDIVISPDILLPLNTLYEDVNSFLSDTNKNPL